jgi:hypothetical protein
MRIVQALAVLVILVGGGLAVAAALVFDDEVDKLATPKRPEQFYGPVRGTARWTGVLGVAHNAGDTVTAARRAIAYGADVLEIDVVAVGGKLRAFHDRPLPFGTRAARGPALLWVWDAAPARVAIELDLKQSGPLRLAPLFDFLRRHRDRDVIVASRSPESLRAFRRHAPWVLRFLSVRSKLQLERLRWDAELRRALDGVSVREALLAAERVRWLHDQGLLVLAWVVDDPARVDDLTGYGVDAIATDNLAIITILGRGRRSGARVASS